MQDLARLLLLPLPLWHFGNSRAHCWVFNLSHVTQSKYAGPCSFSVTAVIEQSSRWYSFLRKINFFCVWKNLVDWMCVLFAQPALQCGVRRASAFIWPAGPSVEGNWGHGPQAYFSLFWGNLHHCHLCQISGLNFPIWGEVSTNSANNKPLPIINPYH